MDNPCDKFVTVREFDLYKAHVNQRFADSERAVELVAKSKALAFATAAAFASAIIVMLVSYVLRK